MSHFSTCSFVFLLFVSLNTLLFVHAKIKETFKTPVFFEWCLKTFDEVLNLDVSELSPAFWTFFVFDFDRLPSNRTQSFNGWFSMWRNENLCTYQLKSPPPPSAYLGQGGDFWIKYYTIWLDIITNLNKPPPNCCIVTAKTSTLVGKPMLFPYWLLTLNSTSLVYKFN